MNRTWTTVKDLRQQVLHLWDKGQLLSTMLDDETDFFPKRLRLKTPSSRELSVHYIEVRDWIAQLQTAKNLRLEMQTLRHKVLGKNDIPKTIWLESLNAAVSMLGKQQEYQCFAKLIDLTAQKQPVLLSWLKAYPLKALALTHEWSRLLAVIAWLKQHPQPEIYIRQANIVGVDTKFIEVHRRILISLLDLSLPASHFDASQNGVSQFEARYGFLQKPIKVRFRLLDPDIQLICSENQDLTLTRQGFSALEKNKIFQQQVSTIFITENEINFLAFPFVTNSLVLFGAGYGFEALSTANWLTKKTIYYWGDIDTHGFAILNQLRRLFPQVHSLLMDQNTLLAHKIFWGKEKRAESRNLPCLTHAEQQLYKQLRDHSIAPNLRLEQEKIGFNWVFKYLEKISVNNKII